MLRDPALLEESRVLQRAVAPYRTLVELHESPAWRELEPRFRAFLGKVRRHAPAQPPPPSADPTRVHAVHWNIEHGNWYEQVETALLGHEALRDADLLLFNEIDLGMARAGNRDVTADLAAALHRYGVWAPLFLETTVGRDDDAVTAAGRENLESLFGLAILSRWPIGAVRLVDLPSPAALQFDLERMVGRHVGLVVEIERPGAPFVAVAAHLEVHRTRAHRAAQVQTVLNALEGEPRPVIFAGDWNTHTFDRGLWHTPLTGASALLLWPGPVLDRRLHRPDLGPFREPLFDRLREARFEWQSFSDFRPTLQVRFDRVDEAALVHRVLGPLSWPVLRWAERRGALRLDWFAGRGWSGGRGRTATGLDGPGLASDHAPIAAEFDSPAA
jgi:endonuclease/exonuclease/phosphatase family metal-dependent hydrolase